MLAAVMPPSILKALDLQQVLEKGPGVLARERAGGNCL